MRGKGVRYLHVLTVTGRSSGQEHSLPVEVTKINGNVTVDSTDDEVAEDAIGHLVFELTARK